MIEVNYNNFEVISKKESGLLKVGHEIRDLTSFIGFAVGIISVIVLF